MTLPELMDYFKTPSNVATMIQHAKWIEVDGVRLFNVVVAHPNNFGVIVFDGVVPGQRPVAPNKKGVRTHV